MTAVSYLGKGSVREGGKVTSCHRVGLHGTLADAELWLGIDDSLPRRLKATRPNSSALLVDVDFLRWDFKAQISNSRFRQQPPAGAVEIPMITLTQANAGR